MAECGADAVGAWRSLGGKCRKSGPEKAAVDAVEEDGDPQAGWGEAIAVGLGYAFDETVKAEATEVVGHPARGELFRAKAQQASEWLAPILVGEAAKLQDEEDQRGHEHLDTRIVEPQGRTMLPIDVDGIDHTTEIVLAQSGVMAESLDVEETSVGIEANLP